MPLTPGDRTLLGDALQPPAGTQVDLAVGTTYSMNLTALLIAPLSFALVEPDGFTSLTPGEDSPRASNIDPIQLLEAVRRYADRTTVFCQAGGIHVPAFRPILTFIEDSVIEVMPPRSGIFHPKIWALRFVDSEGHHTHRLVVQSRNLTLDRSWDTVLVLDEDSAGTIEAGPAAAFLSRLPDLAIREVPADRSRQVDELVASLAGVRFAAPLPFTHGELLPIGLANEYVWPFPERAERLLAISPFLTPRSVDALAPISPEKTLVSRDSAFDLLGRNALSGWHPRVMQPIAETGAEDPVDNASAADTNDGFLSPPDGLHAKTFVMDLADGTSEVITGSANLTSTPWGGSAEFDVRLTGPTSTCGVAAVMDGTNGASGLAQVLDEFWPEQNEGVLDPAYEAERELEAWHHLLATEGQPTFHVKLTDSVSGDAAIRLTIDLQSVGPPDETITTKVWPASLPQSSARELCDSESWFASKGNVTPFLAVQSTMDGDGSTVTRLCVIKAELTGDIGERQQEAMRSLLANSETVLRYIAFLLGDMKYGTLASELTGAAGESFFGRSGAATTTLALFEPLVRAAGHDHEALARIHRLVDDLRSMPDAADLIPDGFDDLWHVVWSAHNKERT